MALERRDRFADFSSLIYNASKSLHRLKTRGMKAYGLGSTHTFCLRTLNGCKDGMTRTQLASACSVDKAQISRLVSELAEMGYLVEESKGAGYRKKIFLTERGRTVATGIDDMVDRVLYYVSGNIPEEAIEQMYQTLGLICDTLKRAEEMSLTDGPILNNFLKTADNDT